MANKYAILTADKAVEMGKNGTPWYDILSEISASCGVQDMGICMRAGIVIPEPFFVRKWVEKNVSYDKAVLELNAKQTAKLTYHGARVTAKKLSDMSGYSINTIYSYWQKAEKDDEEFSAMIDKRMPPEYRNKFMLEETADIEIVSDNSEDYIIC